MVHHGRVEWKWTRWAFLSSRSALRDRVSPLHSAWLDLLILRMMEPCANLAKPVWFVLDELASLKQTSAAPHRRDRTTEVRQSGRARLPWPQPARKAVRSGRRGHALAAGHEDLLQYLRATCCEIISETLTTIPIPATEAALPPAVRALPQTTIRGGSVAFTRLSGLYASVPLQNVSEPQPLSKREVVGRRSALVN